MKRHSARNASIITGAAMLLTVSLAPAATIIEQWTFDTEATANVGINGSTMDKWDPTATGNSWSGGVLTWSERGGATAVSLGSGIDASTIGSLILTVVLTDMALPVVGGSTKDQIRMTFGSSGGNPELEINAFNNTLISPDIEFDGSTGDLDVDMFTQDAQTPPFAVTMVTTWDFVNDQMLFSATGPDGPWSDSIAVAGLATAVGTINNFDLTFDNNVAGSFLALDSVTIETTAIPEPSAPLLLGLGLTAVMFGRRSRR